MEIDISGLERPLVLAGLYNAARPQGMGFSQYDPTPMTVEEAADLLQQGVRFNYLKGRALKTDLDSDVFDPQWFDRYNGEGAAHTVIESLRETSDPNNERIRAIHVYSTKASVADAREYMQQGPSLTGQGDTAVFGMGMADVAESLGPAVDRAEESLER